MYFADTSFVIVLMIPPRYCSTVKLQELEASQGFPCLFFVEVSASDAWNEVGPKANKSSAEFHHGVWGHKSTSCFAWSTGSWVWT